MSDAVEELLTKQAITEVLYRYCRALDRMDRNLALSVWHEGGTADYGTMFQGTGAGFVDWVWEAHAPLAAHSHQITNVLVEVDGDRAASEAYVTVALRSGRSDIVVRGRYVDRWSRRDGVWAIDHRRYLTDLFSTSDAGDPDDGADGRRDRSDPSYEVLSGRGQPG